MGGNIEIVAQKYPYVNMVIGWSGGGMEDILWIPLNDNTQCTSWKKSFNSQKTGPNLIPSKIVPIE